MERSQGVVSAEGVKTDSSNVHGARAFYQLTKSSSLESLSGLGSSLKNTEEIRAFLPRIFEDLSIRTFVDCPCGDWNWMVHVPLGELAYTGLDIIPELIEENKRRFSAVKRDFRVFDAIRSVPPKADLILCRDFLFHLSLPHITAVIENFRESGSKYLLVTTFPEATIN